MNKPKSQTQFHHDVKMEKGPLDFTYREPEIGFPSQILSKISLIDVAYFFIHVNFSTRTTTYINDILLSCELFINRNGSDGCFQDCSNM